MVSIHLRPQLTRSKRRCLQALCLMLPYEILCAQTAITPPTDSVNQTIPSTESQRDPNGPSADGLYWFEVEITIFSSQYGGNTYNEVPVPHKNTLRYFPQLQALQNPLDVYRFAFPPVIAAPNIVLPEIPTNFQSEQDITETESTTASTINEGPVFSPAQPDAFKLLDYDRDPYIKLTSRFSHFAPALTKLANSGEHAVLWHQLWRQPLKNRAQTSAIFIEGGKEFGKHHELEGSLRLSGQANAATLDINIWLSHFMHEPITDADVWTLPDQPIFTQENSNPIKTTAVSEPTAIPTITNIPEPRSWFADQIWHINQSRELRANSLNYIDHPAVGVLIEIRPYLVPEMVAPMTDPAALTKSDFE